MRNVLHSDTQGEFMESAIIDSSALAASAAVTGLSSATLGLRAKVAGGTTVTISWVDAVGEAFNFVEPPVVMIQKVGALGTVELTSSAVGSAVIEVSAGTVDFHVIVKGSKKPAV